jgi:hypothetical protein
MSAGGPYLKDRGGRDALAGPSADLDNFDPRSDVSLEQPAYGHCVECRRRRRESCSGDESQFRRREEVSWRKPRQIS